ncbi:MAG: hypothetical protein QXT25_02880 [Candidatus Anstonellaceae archaeon]
MKPTVPLKVTIRPVYVIRLEDIADLMLLQHFHVIMSEVDHLYHALPSITKLYA